MNSFCFKEITSLKTLQCGFHSIENEKFTLMLTRKIFRQITYLVVSLVELLFSRNFSQKGVKKFRNFHSVDLLDFLLACHLIALIKTC